jgi:hypothetical protein
VHVAGQVSPFISVERIAHSGRIVGNPEAISETAGHFDGTALPPQSNTLASKHFQQASAQSEERVQKGHQNVSFCTPTCFFEIDAKLLQRMAGTTRLELATSAVTGDLTATRALFRAGLAADALFLART